MEERLLLQQAVQGDLESFNSLIITYQDAVFCQACWMLGETQAAGDLTQETFLLAFRKLKSYHGGSFRAWLLRIITHLCLDTLHERQNHTALNKDVPTWKSEGLEPAVGMVDPDRSVEAAVEQADLRRLFQRCLDQLHPDFRAALVLIDLVGVEYPEAAGVLGIPLGTLKSRLSRARLHLRELLQAVQATQANVGSLAAAAAHPLRERAS